jgi:DUF1009 family protein
MSRDQSGSGWSFLRTWFTRYPPPDTQTIGVIAGNGSLPLYFAREAAEAGRRVVAVCHRGETSPEIERLVAKVEWIRVGELGRMISTFRREGVSEVAMVGGINRVRLFGGVKLDLRGARLLSRIRSTKDDLIMRGVASEIESEGITVVDSTVYLKSFVVGEGVFTKRRPTAAEEHDIEVGASALRAMSSEHIGQLVVVRDGVITAVEAVEGSDAAILRGGQLGGAGCVVVKFAKTAQDVRFDVPTVGLKTIQSMVQVKAKVLAVEAGKCIMIEREELLALADQHGIAIVGCAGTSHTTGARVEREEPKR